MTVIGSPSVTAKQALGGYLCTTAAATRRGQPSLVPAKAGELKVGGRAMVIARRTDAGDLAKRIVARAG